MFRFKACDTLRNERAFSGNLASQIKRLLEKHGEGRKMFRYKACDTLRSEAYILTTKGKQNAVDGRFPAFSYWSASFSLR